MVSKEFLLGISGQKNVAQSNLCINTMLHSYSYFKSLYLFEGLFFFRLFPCTLKSCFASRWLPKDGKHFPEPMWRKDHVHERTVTAHTFQFMFSSIRRLNMPGLFQYCETFPTWIWSWWAFLNFGCVNWWQGISRELEWGASISIKAHEKEKQHHKFIKIFFLI